MAQEKQRFGGRRSSQSLTKIVDHKPDGVS